MIFPNIKNRACGYINLNEAGRKWLQRQEQIHRFGNDQSRGNPLNDPRICAEMVKDAHRELGLGFSYGGWLEDRSLVWRGSYLEETGAFTHLGVDLNATAGTEVAIDFDAKVVLVDDDYPEIGGWGPRVIVKHKAAGVHLIYAHLDRVIGVQRGDKLKKGDVFARVGRPPHNGNWYPHVHVQVLSPAAYKAAFDGYFKELDGYGKGKLGALAKAFPDPMKHIRVN